MRASLKKPFPSPLLAFSIALLCALFFPLFLPKLRVFFFVPYLVIILYKSSLLGVLLRSIWVGFLLDLLSTSPLFGFTGFVYTLAGGLLYTQRKHFFEDKMTTLPLMTLFFSLVVTLIQILVLPIFGHSFPVTFRWLMTDLLGMALLDTAYAFLLFTLPFYLYKKIARLIFYAHLRKQHRRQSA